MADVIISLSMLLNFPSYIRNVHLQEKSLFTLEVHNPCMSFGLFATRGQCENKSELFTAGRL